MKAYSLTILSPNISTINYKNEILNLSDFSAVLYSVDYSGKFLGIKDIPGGIFSGFVFDNAVSSIVDTGILNLIEANTNITISVESKDVTDAEAEEFKQSSNFDILFYRPQ